MCIKESKGKDKKRVRRTASVSREAWLNAAYIVLEAEGVEQIKVEKLGRMLELTKGSFCGQFMDRNDLLQALLSNWREKMLEWIELATKNKVDDLASNLRFILSVVEQNALLRFDSALRTWAKQDPAVMDVVKEVDKKRKAYLLDVFTRGGITGEEASARTDVFYGYTKYVFFQKQVYEDCTHCLSHLSKYL